MAPKRHDTFVYRPGEQPHSQLTEHALPDPEPGWHRYECVSVWCGPDLELVVTMAQRSEGWEWTCFGWRHPDDAHKADRRGWVWAPSRDAAEKAAIQFYLQKDD